MSMDYAAKSTVDEIRARFDNDVERFSNLETGQVAAKASLEHMTLVAEAAVATTPRLLEQGPAICDIGCGAGNYTLRLLRQIAAAGGPASSAGITLIDLSRPMLDRAVERITAEGVAASQLETIQADIRDVPLGVDRFDAVIAAQCLHHLRGDAEWRAVYASIGRALRPGGSCWVSDTIDHQNAGVRGLVRQRWADYLESIDGPDYRDHVMGYVDREDTPRPLVDQLTMMRSAGIDRLDVLSVDTRFAVFGGVKSGDSA
ncbi:MAG: class I SAM-dependent methyltransferase [Planctomycetota bacterium]